MIPHEMSKEEINLVKQEFRQGAENAKKSGFDFIQLHAGNGYLVDQFLKNYANKRSDEYGGNIINRCRFALEIIDEFIEIFGKEKTGIRISPIDKFNDIFDSDPFSLFSYFVSELDKKGIAFIEIKETGDQKSWDCKSESEKYQQDVQAKKIKDCCKSLRPFFSQTIINNERLFFKQKLLLNFSLDKESGLKKIQDGYCDLVSFGTLAIANPDLPYRFQNNLELAYANPKYFFTGGEKGYIDYFNYQEKIVNQSN